MTSETPNADRMREKTAQIAGMMTAAHVSMMVALGLRLGLYRAMWGAGPLTSEALAARSDHHERWVREWLYGQAAAGVLDYRGDGRFELSPEGAELLANEDSLSYVGHHFATLPYKMGMVERLPEAFRTGLGLTWDDRGEESAGATEQLFRNWYRQVLVPVALPLLDGVVAKLEAGAKVADVGCGGGLALIEMAKAFPRSQYHGYELSKHAIARGRLNAEEGGLANVTLHDVESDPLPADASFDLICTLDCLHDMTHPDDAAAAIRRAIRDDGVWFIADINCAPTFEGNLGNPMAPMLYTFSVLSCMSSALSHPEGAGLGTCGLPEPKMRELVERAGFRRFRRLDLPHPVNAFYEARV